MIANKEKLTEISKTVEEVLEKYPDTRTNDNNLILRVLTTQKGEYVNKSLAYVLIHTDISFESITRARRKIQRKRPELKDERISDFRKEQKQVYKDFFVGV